MRVIVTVAALLAWVVPLHAAPRHIFNQSSGVWPVGFSYFCMENPARCEPLAPGSSTEMISLSRWIDRLEEVNSKVNASITYREEEVDHWDIAPPAGDCDDFAITKREALAAMGLSRGVMPLAFVLTDHYGSHVVLLINTTDGYMVLDNLTNEVYHLDQMIVHRLSIQDPAKPRNWTQIF